jgi:hypothetical protein
MMMMTFAVPCRRLLTYFTTFSRSLKALRGDHGFPLCWQHFMLKRVYGYLGGILKIPNDVHLEHCTFHIYYQYLNDLNVLFTNFY